MVEIPDNFSRINELDIEPAVLLLSRNRFPAETVLLASIAVSLRKMAVCVCANNAPGNSGNNPGQGNGPPDNPGGGHGGGGGGNPHD